MNDTVQAKPQGYYEALFSIQAVEFTLIDLSLYLLTHPMDAAALQQYNQLSQQLKELTRRFEDQFGPLTHRSVGPNPPYGWVATPWPWEV